MSRTSTARIRFWAALGSMVVPTALMLAAQAGHASPSAPLAPRMVATVTPTPNCPTSSPDDGNENMGYGDLGNENDGDCVVGNGNTANNVNGNANGPNADMPGANAKCPDPEKSNTTC